MVTSSKHDSFSIVEDDCSNVDDFFSEFEFFDTFFVSYINVASVGSSSSETSDRLLNKFLIFDKKNIIFYLLELPISMFEIFWFSFFFQFGLVVSV